MNVKLVRAVVEKKSVKAAGFEIPPCPSSAAVPTQVITRAAWDSAGRDVKRKFRSGIRMMFFFNPTRDGGRWCQVTWNS